MATKSNGHLFWHGTGEYYQQGGEIFRLGLAGVIAVAGALTRAVTALIRGDAAPLHR